MIRRLVRFGGILMVATALVLLGDVAWQLWGTGIGTARAQHRLGEQFQAVARQSKAQQPTIAAPAADVLPAPPPTQAPSALGSLVGHLVIPKIGVNDYVVEGVGAQQLAEGPGHYPGTAPIGGNGNVGIAGHRTTHGAPFYNLNELGSGDPIYLTDTAGQTFTYRVTSRFVVPPSDGAVLDPTGTRSLTLTTCNPRYSATQRLIIRAALVP
jgi:sortase A